MIHALEQWVALAGWILLGFFGTHATYDPRRGELQPWPNDPAVVRAVAEQHAQRASQGDHR